VDSGQTDDDSIIGVNDSIVEPVVIDPIIVTQLIVDPVIIDWPSSDPVELEPGPVSLTDNWRNDSQANYWLLLLTQ